MKPWITGILLLFALGKLAAQDSIQYKLMQAVENNDLRAVKTWVQKGADVNMSVVATKPNYLFLISRKLYLDGLAKTRAGEEVYVSPIHANADKADIKILQYLRSKKANIDAGDSDGKTPMMYALRNPGGQEYALYLLKKGANHLAVDLAGNSVMHYAAFGGNVEGIRMTAGGGLDINVRNHEGITPLHAAAVFSSVDVLQEIVNLGGDIHAVDSAGMNALHYAAAYGDRNRLDWILDQAPELNVAAANGYTPLDIARAARNQEAAIFLKRRGGTFSAYRYQEMLDAITGRKHDALRAILADGADPNRKVEEYPLIVAVSNDDHIAVQHLLDAGAKVEVVSREGLTVMDIALAHAKPNIALSLVRAGIQVDVHKLGNCLDHMAGGTNLNAWGELAKEMAGRVKDMDGLCGKLDIPPLHYAAYLGLEELVDAFLRAGAKVHARDLQGWTALHWTVMKRDLLRLHLEKLRIAERLLAAGAELNPVATAPKELPHTQPYLARRVPTHATPMDILDYAPPKDADLQELFVGRGGASGLTAVDYLENGIRLLDMKQVQTAQLEFTRAISRDRNLAAAYYYHARCMSLQNQYAEVERDLDKAIALNPTYGEAYLARAIARLELQKYPEARKDAEKALESGHPAGEAYYWRGKIKLRMEDRNGACEDFREAGARGWQDAVQAVLLHCR